ncbi:LysR family transcriptional regulator [Lactiplantibacillus carotarum]|uniref:LysR family transcriptional regulator n=1 Tax=Lactiplantibacillus carotarum TaxID=2993456 RepID=UPI00298F2475|nr:LysR family transcriptional regulator [Lactiplantibacillus carotarum]
MNERDLRYFCTLVETGNYTATAEHFKVTQPAISAALRRLETEYGTVLMTQQNHRAKLETTPAGRVLYIKALHLLQELSQVALEVKHANEAQVRIGFSNVAGRIWLPRVIERFIQTHLLDEVVTSVADSEVLLTELRNGKLDAAVFSTLLPETARDLRVTTLEERPFKLLVPASHPLARLQVIEARDLKTIPIVARPKHALPRMALERFCHDGRVRPEIIYEAATNDLVAALVAQNIGVGLVIADSMRLSPDVVSVPLATTHQLVSYMQLAVRKSFIPNQRQQRCIDQLKAVQAWASLD